MQHKFNNMRMFVVPLLTVSICFVLSYVGIENIIPEIVAIILTIGIIFSILQLSNEKLKTYNDYIVFWISFVIEIFYFFVKIYGQDLRSPALDTDAAGFWRVALRYYSGNFSVRYTPFPYILNAEFHIFGVNYACCLLINIWLVMIMRVYIFKAMNTSGIYGNRRLMIIFISCFMPYIIIISNSLLRESIYIVLFSISFWVFFLHISQKKQVYLYMAVFLTLPVLIMHIGYLPIPLCYVIFSGRLKGKVTTRRQFAEYILRLFVLSVFVSIVIRLDSTSYIIGDNGNAIDTVMAKLAGSNRDNSTVIAGSAYLLNLRPNNLAQAIIYSPIRLIYFMFSPMPTNWRGLTDIFAFLLDSCIHLYLILYTVKVLKKSSNNKNIYILATCGLWGYVLSFLVFAMGTYTAGTAIRHRDALIGIELMSYIYANCLCKYSHGRML